MTFRTASYILILVVYLPGLLVFTRRKRILHFPIVSMTFLGMFVFNAVGSIFVMYPESWGRPDFFTPEYVGLLVLQAVMFYLVVTPYLLFSNPQKRRISQNPDFDRPFLKVLLVLMTALVAIYVWKVGTPPLLTIMSSSLNLQDMIRIRTERVYGLTNFWFYNLGFTVIPLFASIFAMGRHVFSEKPSPRLKWVVLLCILVNALPGGKGHVLDFCTILMLSYFLLTGWQEESSASLALPGMRSHPLWKRKKPQFSYWKMSCLLGIAFVPVLFMYKVYLGPMMRFSDLFRPLLYRIVGVYSEAMAGCTVYVKQYFFLDGVTLPTVHGLLGHQRVNLDALMHQFMFGANGSVTLSATAEGYINFGWTGFVLMCGVTYVSMIIVEQGLNLLKSDLLTLTFIAFYAGIATKISQIGLFAVFVSLTYTTLVVMLIVTRKSLELGVELKRTRWNRG